VFSIEDTLHNRYRHKDIHIICCFLVIMGVESVIFRNLAASLRSIVVSNILYVYQRYACESSVAWQENIFYNLNNMKRSGFRRDPDAELVRQAASGNEDAFKEIVHKYQQAVYNTIYHYTGYAEDVEDLAQEVFINVWRSSCHNMTVKVIKRSARS
jgi:hypothetical protein